MSIITLLWLLSYLKANDGFLLRKMLHITPPRLVNPCKYNEKREFFCNI